MNSSRDKGWVGILIVAFSSSSPRVYLLDGMRVREVSSCFVEKDRRMKREEKQGSRTCVEELLECLGLDSAGVLGVEEGKGLLDFFGADLRHFFALLFVAWCVEVLLGSLLL